MANSTTLSDAYREYITRAAKSGTLSVEGINAFTKERGGNPVTNAAEIVDFYKQFGTVNPAMVARKNTDATYDPSKPGSAVNVLPDSPAPLKARNIVKQVDDAGYGVNLTRAVAKGALFDFADELEAATRMLAEGRIDPAEYYRIKNQINTDYAAWAEANPSTALSAELGGGLATTFIPGVGLAGKTIQGVTRMGKIASPVGRAAATGALSGVVSGVGAAPTAQDIPAEVLISGGLGAGLGAALPVVGRAGLGAYEAGRRRVTGAAPLDAAARKAAEITYDTLRRSGLTPQQAADKVRLGRRYGVPEIFGQASPELQRTTETVASTPSAGREGLVERVVQRQKEAPARVDRRLSRAFGNPRSPFAEEDIIADNLKAIGAEDYAKAKRFGAVDDPQIREALTNPIMAEAFKDAQESAGAEVSAAALGGKDPSQFNLTKVYDLVFGNDGKLTGYKLVDTIPDVNTLHEMKVALDKRINSMFMSKDPRAVSYRNLRNAFVKRLDEVVPDYKIARGKYAGELEVRDALRTGTGVFSKNYHPEELQRDMKGMASDAEKKALLSGALKSITQPLETTSKARNFADEIINNPQAKEKLRLLLPPAQYQVVSAALDREAKIYKSSSKMLTGSRTYPLLKEGQTIDDVIAGGTVQDVMGVLMNPSIGTFARMGARLVSLARGGKEFEDKVYTQLANIMKSGTPQELAETVVMLRNHAAALGRKTAVEGQAAGRASVVAGGAAGTPLEQDSYAKPPTATQRRGSVEAKNPVQALEDIRLLGAEAMGGLPVEMPPEQPAPAEPSMAPGPDLQ